jgi:hypothetical protein
MEKQHRRRVLGGRGGIALQNKPDQAICIRSMRVIRGSIGMRLLRYTDRWAGMHAAAI